MTPQTSFATLRGSPPENYERYFVPLIGEPLARNLVERAALRPGESVVDVACGTGIVTRLAAERVGEAALAGVDVNPGMLQVARTVVRGAAIEWIEASADELPLPDRSFDVALCQMGLQFFADRSAALHEMRRVLRPGGRIALNVPGPAPPVLAILERALGTHLGAGAAAFVAQVFSLHDPAELRELLEDAGFASTEARSERMQLSLPAPEDFLWQYVASTPLASPAQGLDDQSRATLEREVVEAWRPYCADGRLMVDLDLTTAVAGA